MRGWKKWLLIGVAAVLLFFGGCVALLQYTYWSAETDARQFCDQIPIGSDISTATAKAVDRKVPFGPSNALEKKVLWEGSDSGVYTFYFFTAFIFDKAVCEVRVTREGKVRSKHSEMELD
ncbi:MAG TPA: hypothetical protein VN175_14545 [Rhizomicrobium sp.]|nr:hypothetical protein [Rhizomicrobium sp.]